MKKEKSKSKQQLNKSMPMHQVLRRPVKRAALFHRKGNRNS